MRSDPRNRAAGGRGVVAAAMVAVCTALAPMTSAVAQPIIAAPIAAPNAPQLAGLVDAMQRRLMTSDAVAVAKWETAQRTGRPPVIDDPAREAQVYDTMAAAGTRAGLPAQWIRQVFTSQIEASKTVQRGLLTRWRLDPATEPAPGSADLAAVRPVIDRVNEDILAELAARRTILSGPDCPARLAGAVVPLLTSGRADGLHAAALLRATVSLCPATGVK
ncbi:MAG: gamma subclass chorismate mutase AroQ [Nocardia sp.]|nr:gamma subclass chorismate mutase AroQ [Nocardia sp.]